MVWVAKRFFKLFSAGIRRGTVVPRVRTCCICRLRGRPCVSDISTHERPGQLDGGRSMPLVKPHGSVALASHRERISPALPTAAMRPPLASRCPALTCPGDRRIIGRAGWVPGIGVTPRHGCDRCPRSFRSLRVARPGRLRNQRSSSPQRSRCARCWSAATPSRSLGAC